MSTTELLKGAAELFPDHRPRLETMSSVFDETRYGDRPACEARARAAVELETELGSRNPDGTGARGPVSMVPR